MRIFDFDDYKKALNSLLDERRKIQKGVSSKIAEHLGVNPSMVSQVLSGAKDFTEEQMLSICAYLGISKLETKYLLVLLQCERAGSKLLKDHFLEMKMQLRDQSLKLSKRISEHRVLSETEKAIFYSSWTYSAIHIMSSLHAEIRFDDICKRLDLPTSVARNALDFLVDIKMINENNGVFTVGTTSTHLEKNSPFLVRHHTNWRLKAIQSAEGLSDEELMYSACFSISNQDFKLLREEMVSLIKKFLTVVPDSPAEDIAQFSLDFFWVCKNK